MEEIESADLIPLPTTCKSSPSVQTPENRRYSSDVPELLKHVHRENLESALKKTSERRKALFHEHYSII